MGGSLLRGNQDSDKQGKDGVRTGANSHLQGEASEGPTPAHAPVADTPQGGVWACSIASELEPLPYPSGLYSCSHSVACGHVAPASA